MLSKRIVEMETQLNASSAGTAGATRAGLQTSGLDVYMCQIKFTHISKTVQEDPGSSTFKIPLE